MRTAMKARVHISATNPTARKYFDARVRTYIGAKLSNFEFDNAI